jgi:hypothetical protein
MAHSLLSQRLAALAGRLLSVIAVLAVLILAAPAGAIGPASPMLQDAAAVITAPQSGQAVRGSVQIIGSALHPAFQRYELYFTAEPGENWVFIGDARTTPVSNSVLGTWETGGLPDGNYSLRLRVVRQDGNYDEGFARNVVVANTTPPTPVPTDTPAFDVEATLPPPIEGVVTPTPPATPTAAAVEQPDIPTPTPRPSPTATPESQEQAAADSGASGDDSGGASLTDALETSTLQSSFVRGASLAAAVFLAVGAFFGVRRLFTWLWYLIAP